MIQKTKSTLKRFLKGFLSGAVASMLLVAIPSISSWGDISTWLSALAVSGVIGGLTGLFLAVQKWASWVDGKK